MKKRHKSYLKLNLISLVFITISFISVTLAWFAYSGIVGVDTEVNVKAWYIEIEKNNEKVSNDITITLDNVYPGMEPISEIIKIRNLGDSNASVNYEILNARVLGDSSNYYEVNENSTSKYIEDLLSHDFPFKINIDLSKNYVLTQGEETLFEISISWPLDSDQDELDSYWGTMAYDFQKAEENKKQQNSSYQTKSSIQLQISLIAEQYLDIASASDLNYPLGSEILIDIINNKKCEVLEETCIKTFVLDVNNTIGDNTVNLLPLPYNDYITSNFTDYSTSYDALTELWQVSTRHLYIKDLLSPISKNIIDSYLVREVLSDRVIGNLSYPGRLETEIALAVSYNGFYRFNNVKINHIGSNDCYWTNTEYDSEKAFAVIKEDENTTKLYGESKETICKIIPVITMEKNKLI